LDLDPALSEAPAQETGQFCVILGGREDLEVSFAIFGGHFQSRVILEHATDTKEMDCLKIWLDVCFGECLAPHLFHHRRCCMVLNAIL
jgi:hypothetical protein